MSTSERWIVRNIEEFKPITVEERSRLVLEASEFMNPESWAFERYLATTKWFGYRFMSPINATLRFIEEYQFAYQMHWSRSFSKDDAPNKRCIASGGLYHNRREFSTFWNARAHADSLGVPYRHYVSYAFEAHLRRAKQKRLPRPNQIRRDDCVALVLRKWEEELSGSRWMSELPHYRQENFCGLPMQIAHQDHVASTTRKRSNARFAIAGSIEAWRVLPIDKAQQACGIDVVKIALEAVGGMLSPLPIERLPDEELIPSCFGLPVIHEPVGNPCDHCPLAEACVAETARVSAKVLARFGSDNPTSDHKRMQQRERQRRRRQRLRAEKAEATCISMLSSTAITPGA
ncbi:hypothetical protein FV222_02585 [Methylobacterium sp. WL103]|uniref:hypothetical protein n=1 Tax=Methylobacterium sp. WL103 TaxID=2603891 RepID=UPI0011CB8085|nr:hypothetical protein [Methylobacterium sp. WL103]TXN07331.1 hypothetical protein FV222_02585 [Methylobacterium sp. WL103]